MQRKILQGLKDNPKRFYAHLRGLQTVKAKVRQLKRNDGSTTASDEEAAAELCRAFQKVFIQEVDSSAFAAANQHADSTTPLEPGFPTSARHSLHIT